MENEQSTTSNMKQKLQFNHSNDFKLILKA